MKFDISSCLQRKRFAGMNVVLNHVKKKGKENENGRSETVRDLPR